MLSATSSLIGSRIRIKQAVKIEADFVKSKPSPKVKMVYTGHRNSRTIVKLNKKFLLKDHHLKIYNCVWRLKSVTFGAMNMWCN